MFERAMTLILVLSYGWAKYREPRAVQDLLVGTIDKLYATAIPGDRVAFFRTVRRFVCGESWSLIWQRIGHEHDNRVLSASDLADLEANLRNHFIPLEEGVFL